MNKLAMMTLTLAALCGTAFAVSVDFPINSKGWEKTSHNLKVVNVCSLSDSDFNIIMLGNSPETAVEFKAQSSMPIGFYLKGDLVNLLEEGNFGNVEIKQTFYIRSVEQELIFSTDLSEWKPFLEFVRGTLSVTLSIEDGKPFIVIGAETNQRF
ncbi:MAG TPA: hypothetical protein VGP47_05760 [Parachlamydiaceae bacterium]|nr:hypothetical protein [Parachlamydiaceae bacterium]